MIHTSNFEVNTYQPPLGEQPTKRYQEGQTFVECPLVGRLDTFSSPPQTSLWKDTIQAKDKPVSTVSPFTYNSNNNSITELVTDRRVLQFSSAGKRPQIRTYSYILHFMISKVCANEHKLSARKNEESLREMYWKTWKRVGNIHIAQYVACTEAGIRLFFRKGVLVSRLKKRHLVELGKYFRKIFSSPFYQFRFCIYERQDSVPAEMRFQTSKAFLRD